MDVCKKNASLCNICKMTFFGPWKRLFKGQKHISALSHEISRKSYSCSFANRHFSTFYSKQRKWQTAVKLVNPCVEAAAVRQNLKVKLWVREKPTAAVSICEGFKDRVTYHAFIRERLLWVREWHIIFQRSFMLVEFGKFLSNKEGGGRGYRIGVFFNAFCVLDV